MYKIKVGADSYNIPATELKSYSLSLEEQREWSLRGSDQDVTFYSRKVILPDVHEAILSTFYDQVYNGPMHINSFGVPSIFIDNDEFPLRTFGAYCFSCIERTYKCRAFFTTDGKRLLIRVENHSEDVSHNHNDTPLYRHAMPIDVPQQAKALLNALILSMVLKTRGFFSRSHLFFCSIPLEWIRGLFGLVSFSTIQFLTINLCDRGSSNFNALINSSSEPVY